MSVSTISLHAPASWPFTSPVVPARFMPSGRAYNPDANGLIAAVQNDVPALLGFGFYVVGAGASPLTALSDVTVASPADSDVLTWVTSAGRWENKVNAAGGGITELTGVISAGPGTGSQATTLSAKAVAYANVQDVASAKLLGNPTGSSTVLSEISLGSGLSFSGSTLNVVASAQVNVISGGTYDLATTDNGKLLVLSAGSATVVTVSAGVVSGGFETTIVDLVGGGSVVAASGTTLISPNGSAFTSAGSLGALVAPAADVVVLGGDTV